MVEVEGGSSVRQLLGIVLGLALVATASACTTRGRFVIPEGTALEVYRRPVTLDPDGVVVTRPFFWTAAGIAPRGGAEYRLLKDGQVVQEGRLRVQFRVVSLFWPPLAEIYWPIGLNPDITYDLVKGTQE
jgi:hypothetical protein